MKKTISITLGGQLYAIEEDGYTVLETYLTGLKQHFAGDESVNELLSDIEMSLGEKFSQKIGPHQGAVTLENVSEAIALMGNVEEIANDTDGRKKDTGTAPTGPEPHTPKRLYRNEDDTIIAGVCSGLAAYTGVDPVLIRILFVILTLANGLGVFAYMILWVAVPPAKTSAQKLQMRGKPANLSELQELVKEKAETIQKEGKDALERMRQPNSIFYRVIQVPITLIASIADILRSLFRQIGPILSTLVGLIVLLGSVIGIGLLTAFATILFFRIGSSSLISDLPLAELAGNPLYYIGIVAGYLLLLVPLFFITLIGVTLLRRKSSLSVFTSAVLFTIWIISAGAMALSASEIGPWGYARLQQIEHEQTISRTFEETDFYAVEVAGSHQVTITQGDAFAVNFTGLKKNIDELSLVKDNGVLKITSTNTRQGHCFLCLNRPVRAEIVLPALQRFTGKDVSRTTIEGFTQPIDIHLQDVARLELTTEAETIQMTLRDISRAVLEGSTRTLTVHTQDLSRLNAVDLRADHVSIVTQDGSRASINALQSLVTTSTDISRIDYEDGSLTPQTPVDFLEELNQRSLEGDAGR